jgi:hypothetical protein
VSTDELHEQMDRTFQAISPRPAPVEDAIRRGRTIRRRRRVAATVGLAAVVVAAVSGIPALTHRSAAPPPATPPPDHGIVTVQVPGPHSEAGLIASGTVNGQDWQVTVRPPGSHGTGPGQQSIYFGGRAWGDVQQVLTVPELRADSAVPVSFGDAVGSIGTAPSGPQAQYGGVRDDVSYVTVRLGDGSVFTLHPVTVYGTRAIAFVSPEGIAITDVTAYSRAGEIARAVPFNDPHGPARFGVWLRPGQQGSPRGSHLVGSGTFQGQPWSAIAHTGPWGTCLSAGVGGLFDTRCATPAARTGIMFSTLGFRQVVCGVAAPSVIRVVAHRSDGSTIEVRPVAVSGQKFFAFPATDRGTFRWTAYDGSGAVVASG